jgi:hypothetical protein
LLSSAHAGTGDIEMNPRKPARELLEKQRSRNRPARPSAGVHHVGDLAAKLILVFVEERHRPAAIACALRDITHVFDERRGRAE